MIQTRSRARSCVGRLWHLVLATLVIALVALPGATTSRVAEAQGSGYEVTVTPSTDIIDGKQIVINIKSFPGQLVYRAQAQICRAGVDYQPGTTDLTNPDFSGNGPNCPRAPVSTAGTGLVTSESTITYGPTAEGDTMFVRAGVGRITWTFDGAERSLSCDPSNPCALVVQILTGPEGQAPIWTPVVTTLTFADTDPVAGCGGGAPGFLEAAGSDALGDAWIAWTLGTCKTDGTSGAWSGMSFQDETLAVNRLARGELDIAYTGVGYDPEAGFLNPETLPPEGARPAVAVPVGIGAAVLALGNGWVDPNSNRKLPYGPASLTLDEAAAMVAGGDVAVEPYLAAIGNRNPELSLPSVFSSTGTIKVAGPSEGGVTPWVTSRHFDTTRPDVWKVPNSAQFGADAGRDRGPVASLALADPTFSRSLALLTGRPGLAKELGAYSPATAGGGVWFMTDLTTALAYDLQPVSIGTADGSAFVTAEAGPMAAAADAMPLNDSGMRIPDAQGSTGYPLTYVVYAMVPAQPLTDSATGACRADSQALLAKWLPYLVRDGQQSLPAGLAPLTPTLQAEAEAALQQVGQTPGADCVVPPITPPGGLAPTPVPTGSTGVGGATTAPASTSSGSATTSAGGTADVDAVEQANADLTVSDSDVPGFLGGTLPSVLAALVALLGIGGLTALAARRTSSQTGPAIVLSTLPSPPDPPVGP